MDDSTEDFAALFEASIKAKRFKEGQTLEGRIVAIGPDLVVMDREENRREDYDAVVARGIHVLAVHVRNLGDVPGALSELRAALGLPPERDPLIDSAPTPPRRTALV